MLGIMFVCHGSMLGSRELEEFMGQNGANHGNRSSGILRMRNLKLAVWGSGQISLCSTIKKPCKLHRPQLYGQHPHLWFNIKF